MSVPAPVGAGTNDERDESGEGDCPLEERCRIRHACIPPNHEIFTSQEMSADKSRFANCIVLYPVHDASPQRGKNPGLEAAHTGLIPRDPQGPAASWAAAPAEIELPGSVPAPIGAGTDDERDESRECHRPLEERGRVQRACMPTNHEIFHLLEVAAFGSSGYGLILSMLEIRASPGSVRFRLGSRSANVPISPGPSTSPSSAGASSSSRTRAARGPSSRTVSDRSFGLKTRRISPLPSSAPLRHEKTTSPSIESGGANGSPVRKSVR